MANEAMSETTVAAAKAQVATTEDDPNDPIVEVQVETARELVLENTDDFDHPPVSFALRDPETGERFIVRGVGVVIHSKVDVTSTVELKLPGGNSLWFCNGGST